MSDVGSMLIGTSMATATRDQMDAPSGTRVQRRRAHIARPSRPPTAFAGGAERGESSVSQITIGSGRPEPPSASEALPSSLLPPPSLLSPRSDHSPKLRCCCGGCAP